MRFLDIRGRHAKEHGHGGRFGTVPPRLPHDHGGAADATLREPAGAHAVDPVAGVRDPGSDAHAQTVADSFPGSRSRPDTRADSRADTRAPAPTPPPSSGTCTNPAPPPLTRIDAKVHIRGANRITLDSTPLVGPDADYCRKIGFTDGRRFCPARPEGHPERSACDGALIGRAKDTGRIGPTWTVSGKACVLENGCENHPDNQFLAFAYARSGTLYEACAENGVCGGVTVE